ncbi:MAG TPA: nitroreductase [Allosphingosinicella sp.]|uniref:nitroreductase family protein n=1 Tax=Allosphingosinicella sp. TaxID=2823234 RepID=UPI002F2A8F6E
MLNDRSSALSLLRTRRSGRPRDLIEPGPDAEQLRDILSIAMRVPDHGKLSPWRFIVVRKEDRPALEALLHRAFRIGCADPTRPELEAVTRYANQAPALVVVLSSPIEGHKVPVWEQQLSAGAACMNLLNAAHALGFAGGWITGWPTYSDEVRRAFGRDGETIAGFMFIGTPGTPLEERPRPDYDRIVSTWAPSFESGT